MVKEYNMKIKSFSSALLLTCSLSVLADNQSFKDDSNIEKNELIKAISHQKQVAWAIAPITTIDLLNEVAKKKSALDLLSPLAKERFINSIVFRENGLGGFYYGDLEAELTPTQIHRILSMFGAQHTVSKYTNARIETEEDVLLLSSPNYSLESISLKNKTNQAHTMGYARPPGLFDDHKNYSCSEPSTCRDEQGAICMSSC